jgi:hypothetical protein
MQQHWQAIMALIGGVSQMTNAAVTVTLLIVSRRDRGKPQGDCVVGCGCLTWSDGDSWAGLEGQCGRCGPCGDHGVADTLTTPDRDHTR